MLVVTVVIVPFIVVVTSLSSTTVVVESIDSDELVVGDTDVVVGGTDVVGVGVVVEVDVVEGFSSGVVNNEFVPVPLVNST